MVLVADNLAVEIAPGGDPADSSTWVWQEITQYVRHEQGVTITTGRKDEGGSVDASVCQLTLDNTDGRFSPRNPNGAYYPNLGLNTPLRVRWGGKTPVGDDNSNTTGTASHVAPSVNASANSMLVSSWMSGGASAINYTIPGSMTAVGTETDGSTSTMHTARENVGAGATGTRTATASLSVPYAAVSVALSGTGSAPTLEQTLGGTTTSSVANQTTAVGTQAGWWLLAIQANRLADPNDLMPAQPGGSDAGSNGTPYWTLVADTGAHGTLPRVKAWIRMVANTGEQTVQFVRGVASGDMHMRVMVLSGMGAERFTGFVSEWPPRWDKTGIDAVVPIQADGILRRLRQGGVLRSSLYRDITGQSDSPAGYWPMEDPSGSVIGASGVGGNAMRPYVFDPALLTSTDVTPQWGNDSIPDGSQGGVQLPAGWAAQSAVPATQTTTISLVQWTVEFWVQFEVAGAGDLVVQLQAPGEDNIQLFEILVGNGLTMRGLNEDRSSVTSILPGGVGTPTAGAGPHHIVVTKVPDAGGVPDEVFGYVDGVLVQSADLDGSNRINQISVQNDHTTGDAATVCHVAVWERALTAAEVADRYKAGVAFVGETAGARMARLCGEEGVPFAIVGLNGDTAPMGPQTPQPLLSLLLECEDADGGILHEDSANRAGPAGLTYLTRFNRYNRAPIVALDVDSGHVADPPEPTDDDRHITNDITATRTAGGQATAIDDSTSSKGTYDKSISVNVATDDQLPHIAGWLLHLGTVDEMRWPQIQLDLASNPSLIPTWLALPIGGRLTIDHTITQLPGVDVDILVEGWTERIDQFQWDVELNCVPASPWKVGVWDTSRWDTSGSELATQFVAGTDTSMSVSVTDGPLWTTAGGDFPFDIRVSGVVLRVTAISGASSPQTFTVQQVPINGITKTIPAGSALSLAEPMVWAL